MRYPIYRQVLLLMCLGVLSLPAAIGAAWVCEELWRCGQIALIIAIATAVVANAIITLYFYRYRRCPKCGARTLTISAEAEAFCIAPYWATCRRCGAQMITDTGVTTGKLPVHLRPGEGE